MPEVRLRSPRSFCAPIAVIAALACAPAAGGYEQKLTPSDATASSRFGQSVAIDGTTIVVGQPYKGNGAVYVFDKVGDSWTQTGKLTATDGAPMDHLGVSVAIDGDTIVAGANGDNIGADTDEGSVYTFAREGAAERTETAKLFVLAGDTDDLLGSSVAIDGPTIVAGAPQDDDPSFSNQGSVYRFARTGPAVRNEVAAMAASTGQADDRLGGSVAIDGDTIVAGATLDDTPAGNNSGSLWTFPSAGTGAVSETGWMYPSGTGGGLLGSAVAIEGDTIIGGSRASGPINQQGAVFVFPRTGPGVWNETGTLVASDPQLQVYLGLAADLDDGRVVAGALSDADRGAMYEFEVAGTGERTETRKLVAADGAPDDLLGGDVAVDGPVAVAAAQFDDIDGVNSVGSVTVFFDVPPDTTPPETTVSGPKRVRKGKRARFSFASSEPGSTFLCHVGKRKPAPCISPRKVRTKKLKAGKRQKFKVTAVDASGNADPTPAVRKFKVLAKKP